MLLSHPVTILPHTHKLFRPKAGLLTKGGCRFHLGLHTAHT